MPFIFRTFLLIPTSFFSNKNHWFFLTTVLKMYDFYKNFEVCNKASIGTSKFYQAVFELGI